MGATRSERIRVVQLGYVVNLEYVQVRPEHADALVALEASAFPTADRGELLSVAGVLKQCEMFPEGGYVVVDHDAGERVAAFAMGCFVDFDFDHPQHHLNEVVGPLGSDYHLEFGEWYYGTDIAVADDYRRLGIGRQLYELRKDLIRRFNRAGMVAGGVIPGFANHKFDMTADEYVARVAARELTDPTLTMQLDNGFEALGALKDYWTDPAVDSWASLIVWRNPDFDPDRLAVQRARSLAGPAHE